jgi:uncharacterized sodium:solute symporter family permease YidK
MGHAIVCTSTYTGAIMIDILYPLLGYLMVSFGIIAVMVIIAGVALIEYARWRGW